MIADAEERERRLAERKRIEAEEQRAERKKEKKKEKKARQAQSKTAQPVNTTTSTSSNNTTTSQSVNSTQTTNPTQTHANLPAASIQHTSSTQSTKSTNQSTTSTKQSTKSTKQTTNSKSDQSTESNQSTPAWSHPSQAQGKKPQNPTITFKDLERTSRPDYAKLGSLTNLPFDSLLQALSYLSLSEVGSLALVSKDMNKVLSPPCPPTSTPPPSPLPYHFLLGSRGWTLMAITVQQALS